jgi:threonine/homoserine/homoserine lactone efflux protein
MENINHLLIVFTAYVIAAGSPGPSTLRIMGVAMNHGRRAWIALVTLGLGTEPSWRDVATILAGCAILSVMIFAGYALVFSTEPMIRLYRRARRGIEGVLAAFFGFAGLRLLMSRF